MKLISRKIWVAEKFWNFHTTVWKLREHTVEISEFYCSTCTLPRYFRKNSVKLTIYWRTLPCINLTEKNLHGRVNFSFFHTTVGNSLSRIFGKNFLKVTVSKKLLNKYLIWRNIFSVRVNFRNFHSAQCGKTRNSLSPKKYFVKSTLW